MPLEEKVKICSWKKCIENEKNIYGKPLPGNNIVMTSRESFLYDCCDKCDGKKKECAYYVCK